MFFKVFLICGKSGLIFHSFPRTCGKLNYTVFEIFHKVVYPNDLGIHQVRVYHPSLMYPCIVVPLRVQSYKDHYTEFDSSCQPSFTTSMSKLFRYS